MPLLYLLTGIFSPSHPQAFKVREAEGKSGGGGDNSVVERGGDIFDSQSVRETPHELSIVQNLGVHIYIVRTRA